MIRALVFDLDGTLVHSLPGIASSLNRVLAAAGHPTHPQESVRSFIGNGVIKLVQRALPTAADDHTAEIADAFRRDYADTWAQGTSPYPHIPEALADLAGRAPLAVWSNKPHDFTNETVTRLFPDIPFAAIIGERAGVPRKPDPACVPELAAALDCDPAAIAMVGDSTTDLEAARNAGFRAVAVTWGYHDRDRLYAATPDHWVERPVELPALVTGV